MEYLCIGMIHQLIIVEDLNILIQVNNSSERERSRGYMYVSKARVYI